MPIANKTTNKMYELQSNSACCDQMLWQLALPYTFAWTILTRMFTFKVSSITFQQWNCNVTTQANYQNLIIKTLSLKMRMWKMHSLK
jgi:hypothetical protein